MFAVIVKFILVATCFQNGSSCNNNPVDQRALRDDYSLMNNIVPSTESATNPWLSYYYNSQQQGRSTAGKHENNQTLKIENQS